MICASLLQVEGDVPSNAAVGQTIKKKGEIKRNNVR